MLTLVVNIILIKVKFENVTIGDEIYIEEFKLSLHDRVHKGCDSCIIAVTGTRTPPF